MKTANIIKIISLSVVLVSCKPKQEEDTTGPAQICLDDELKKITDTMALNEAEGDEILKLTGNVAYDENKVYRFRPLLSGVVQRVHFSLGDFVKKGQILLEIRSAELNEMNSHFKEVANKLKIAQRHLNAEQNLYADGVASDREVLEAQLEVSNLASEMKKIKESLAIYGGNIESGVLSIRAQSAGFIVEKNIVDGQQVENGNDPLFVIGDLSKVWVMANVYAGNITAIKNGLKVDIRSTAYPEKIFRGEISRISNVIDPNQKVLKAIIELDNPAQLLKPEMMTTIDVHLDKKTKKIAIPLSATIFDNDKYHFVSVKDSCHLEIINFIPDYEDSSCYYTTSSADIQIGNQVIRKNSLLLYNKLLGK